ncbi:type IV pilus twitching motility protein PilT [Anaerovorax odorimutans]|uniref:type IV pilus twitching motility protein PilT n=1 Tax=Anaerovorax odorimutans TaxID=109327 RepID=UPI000422A8D9|nr:type IV pilus twitching motility protein PilT [Anaerovorax odorimutans]
MNFYEMAQKALEVNASDIHLSSGNYPAVRINGQIMLIGDSPLTKEGVESIVQICIPPDKFKEYNRTGDIDCSIDMENIGRFRVNVFRQNKGTTIVFRTIKAKVPDLKELMLPPQINKILELNDGLVLVTGPTGSGKSTTLAALINEMNKNRRSHIITIEDPIEYVHTAKNCIINQREVGSDSKSYARALKAALREDPDIILVGEMRDLESISIALTAAETGHLVLSTLHTMGAAMTIDRMVDVFPPQQQQQIKTQLSLVLKSVVSQRLLPKSSGNGRIGAFEIMYVNNAISNLIKEGKTSNINQMIQTGYSSGMITLERNIKYLVDKGIITEDVASTATYDIK